MDSTTISILVGFVTLILTVPLAILANMNTPKVQSYLQRRAVAVNGKKMEGVLREYREIMEQTRDSPQRVILRMFLKLGLPLFSMVGLLIGIGLLTILNTLFSPVSSGVTAVGVTTPVNIVRSFIIGAVSGGMATLSVFGFYGISSFIRSTYRIYYFDKYKKRVIAQIQKLGGNSEELLKNHSGG